MPDGTTQAGAAAVQSQAAATAARPPRRLGLALAVIATAQLGRLAATQQHQLAEDPDRDQVEQSKRHKPRFCRNQLIGPNSSSRHPR